MAVSSKTFTTNNFLPDAETGKYVYSLNTSDTGFSTVNYRVAKLLRDCDDGSQKNAVCAYRIFDDKHIEIYSDQPFNGRIVLVTDV